MDKAKREALEKQLEGYSEKQLKEIIIQKIELIDKMMRGKDALTRVKKKLSAKVIEDFQNYLLVDLLDIDVKDDPVLKQMGFYDMDSQP